MTTLSRNYVKIGLVLPSEIIGEICHFCQFPIVGTLSGLVIFGVTAWTKTHQISKQCTGIIVAISAYIDVAIFEYVRNVSACAE